MLLVRKAWIKDQKAPWLPRTDLSGKMVKIVTYRFGIVPYLSRVEFDAVDLSKLTFPNTIDVNTRNVRDLTSKYNELYGFIIKPEGDSYTVYFESENKINNIKNIAITDLSIYKEEKDKEEKEKEEEEERKRNELEKKRKNEQKIRIQNSILRTKEVERIRNEQRKKALEIHQKENSGLLSFLFGTPKMREAQCFKCHSLLFSSTHKQCPVCNWMICQCGACGCNYKKL